MRLDLELLKDCLDDIDIYSCSILEKLRSEHGPSVLATALTQFSQDAGPEDRRLAGAALSGDAAGGDAFGISQPSFKSSEHVVDEIAPPVEMVIFDLVVAQFTIGIPAFGL